MHMRWPPPVVGLLPRHADPIPRLDTRAHDVVLESRGPEVPEEGPEGNPVIGDMAQDDDVAVIAGIGPRLRHLHNPVVRRVDRAARRL